jgi:hypothetical protein
VLAQQTTKTDARPVAVGKAARGNLPFTGLPAWIEVFGLLLVVGGLVIRRLTL